MEKFKVAPIYSEKYLEIKRPSPLSDLMIENLIQEILNGNFDKDISDNVYFNFKNETINWLSRSKLNQLHGLNNFNRIDIINGCTQYIDTLYMNSSIQTIKGDYRYHERLGLYVGQKDPGDLIPNIPLIIAMPFPSTGSPHINMKEILNECLTKNIFVHIDGAWITCCRDIDFDFSHPAIVSVGISLSKGLGLGWNRIGIRWSKENKKDAITLMNDFRMNSRALSMIGLHFIRNLQPDYLWNKYEKIYYKICKDFDLTPTKAIYLALRNGEPVGVSPLIRYVAEQ